MAINDNELEQVTGGCGADLFPEENEIVDPRIRSLEIKLADINKMIEKFAAEGDHVSLKWAIERKNEILVELARLKGE